MLKLFYVFQCVIKTKKFKCLNKYDIITTKEINHNKHELSKNILHVDSILTN